MSEIICYCKNITKDEIEKAINNGADTIKRIQEETQACTGNQCKELNPKGVCCSTEILKMIGKKKGLKDIKGSSCCCC